MNYSDLAPSQTFTYALGVVWFEWLTDRELGLGAFLNPDEKHMRMMHSLGMVLYDPPGCYFGDKK